MSSGKCKGNIKVSIKIMCPRKNIKISLKGNVKVM